MHVVSRIPIANDNHIIFLDGVPQDGVRINTTVTIHVATTVIFTVLASSGIAFTVICLVFNCYFRNKMYVCSINNGVRRCCIPSYQKLRDAAYGMLLVQTQKAGVATSCALSLLPPPLPLL